MEWESLNFEVIFKARVILLVINRGFVAEKLMKHF
jgi:hypothetical protein